MNKFRGDAGTARPGLDRLRELTGRPVLGVLPWTDGLWLDAEDSLSLGTGHRRRPAWSAAAMCSGWRWSGCRGSATSPTSTRWRPSRACVVRFAPPADLADADLVVLPGSRATVADLAWLRERGLAEAVTERARAGRPVLGICGGYQMLAARSTTVESRRGLAGARPAAGARRVRRREGAPPPQDRARASR